MLHYLVDEEATLRTIPHEAHLPFQHVPELGELIEMMTADESTDAGAAVIFILAELRMIVFLGIRSH